MKHSISIIIMTIIYLLIISINSELQNNIIYQEGSLFKVYSSSSMILSGIIIYIPLVIIGFLLNEKSFGDLFKSKRNILIVLLITLVITLLNFFTIAQPYSGVILSALPLISLIVSYLIFYSLKHQKVK